MVDITLRYKGDASGAVAATRDVAAASEEMAGAVDETTESLGEQAEATEEASKAQEGMALNMRDVVRVAKEVIKFVGDSVKEYLKSADANKELARTARDLEAAQKGLKKSIGEATLEIAKQLQLAEAAQGALSFFQTLIKGDSEENLGRERRMNELLAANAELRAARINGAASEIEAASKRVLAAQRAMGIAPGQAIDENFVAGADAQAAAEEAAKKAKAVSDKRMSSAEQHAEEMARLAKKNADDMRKIQKDEDESDLLAEKAANKALLEEMKRHSKELWTERDAEDAREKSAVKARADELQKIAADLEKQQAVWARAGDAIGSAFVSALSNQLGELSRGGGFDAALFVGNILAASVAVAGNVIGSAMGQPAIGAAIGNLAAMGVQAAAGEISRSEKQRKGVVRYHEGGWVGAGNGDWSLGVGEVATILKEDERVLGPQEIQRMGGPRAVDRAASGMGGGVGGASMVVQVQAIDSKDAARGFQQQLGVAVRRAMASGQGQLPRLLGRRR